MKSKDTAIKEVKGYSSAYPYICNLKLLPNIDGTWITIQDDVGTSMTVKVSDLSNYMHCEISKVMIKAQSEDADKKMTLELLIKSLINDFRDYQKEWLTSHNDIEFDRPEEYLILAFLDDTADSYISEHVS